MIQSDQIVKLDQICVASNSGMIIWPKVLKTKLIWVLFKDI